MCTLSDYFVTTSAALTNTNWQFIGAYTQRWILMCDSCRLHNIQTLSLSVLHVHLVCVQFFHLHLFPSLSSPRAHTWQSECYDDIIEVVSNFVRNTNPHLRPALRGRSFETQLNLTDAPPDYNEGIKASFIVISRMYAQWLYSLVLSLLNKFTRALGHSSMIHCFPFPAI